MVGQTENHQLDSEITLHDSSQTPLTVRAIALSLTKQNNELIACRLTFQVNPQLYQRIDTAALFNLKPDARNPLSSGKFLSEPDITALTAAMRYIPKSESFDRREQGEKLYCIIAASAVPLIPVLNLIYYHY